MKSGEETKLNINLNFISSDKSLVDALTKELPLAHQRYITPVLAGINGNNDLAAYMIWSQHKLNSEAEAKEVIEKYDSVISDYKEMLEKKGQRVTIKRIP